MRKSDEYRKSIINQIITEGKTPNNRVKFTYNGEVNSGYYSEVITIDEISKVFGDNVLFFLEDFHLLVMPIQKFKLPNCPELKKEY